MLINNLKIALRRLARQKTTTSLHVLGLTLGMTTCLLIGLYLRHELSYDSWYAKADRTYRVNTVWTDFGKKSPHFSTPFPMADALRTDFPEFENVTNIHHPQNSIIEINPQRRFKQNHVMMTDPDFLEIFDVEVLEGNAHEALRQPYTALLTEATAKKFFGSEPALAKTFKYNNDFDITVGGVIRDFPGNTHLPASMLLSLSPSEKYVQTNLTHFGSVSGGSTFVVLPEGLDPKTLDSRLKAIYDRTTNNDDRQPKEVRSDLELQPLSDIHFNASYSGGGEWVQAVNTTWLWFFGIIGLMVLALACINFVNLSTAQALNRAKEVGVRKTVGAGKGQLIGQFLGESWLLALFSGVLAVAATQASLPWLNQLVNKQISFGLLQSPGLLSALLLGIVLTGLLAGLHPAFAIARFNPVDSLKTGSSAGDKRSSLLRKTLVVAQFSISVGLLIALLLIGQQMNYLRSKNLGFEKDNIVMVSIPNGSGDFAGNNAIGGDAKSVFAAELAKIPQVKEYAFSSSPPSGEGHWGTVMSLKDYTKDPNRQEVTCIWTDEHYYKMYGFKLLSGRFPVAADTSAISQSLPEGQRYPRTVVNEALVKALGFASPEAALGQRFVIGMNGYQPEVVGVVADFNANSLHETVKPTLITQYLPWCEKVGIKIEAGGDVPKTLAAIESVWKKTFPKGIYDYHFIDQKIDEYYKAEERLFSLFQIFAGLAMLISCLGLWGLATFAAQQRTKEIGVRKVLGASVSGIVGLLSREFLALVIVSLAIATPLAYFGMKKWLQDFAFRIDIQWSVFALAGLVAVAIAFLTVSFQSIKAALANPVKSLRSE
ncbi:MAG: ABC transporter permease [Saprospiraceae bacterium]|nr:ABC transporter permease [Saprospiraceae bacterium]